MYDLNNKRRNVKHSKQRNLPGLSQRVGVDLSAGGKRYTVWFITHQLQTA